MNAKKSGKSKPAGKRGLKDLSPKRTNDAKGGTKIMAPCCSIRESTGASSRACPCKSFPGARSPLGPHCHILGIVLGRAGLDRGRSGGPVTGDDRKGSITLEKATQQFALPREGREFTAVQDVSFEVGVGEFVSIVGPFGLRQVDAAQSHCRAVPVTEGRIGLDGQPVDGVNQRLGFVFQRDAIFPWKTVAQNVGFPLLFRGVDAASARPRVAEWIARIGLTGFEDYHPHQLSGGMRSAWRWR